MKSTVKLITTLIAMIVAMVFVMPVAAQDCQLDIAASTPTSRFVDNADGTVTDSATALTWKRCSEGQAWNGTTCTGNEATFTWQQALQVGTDAAFAGASDWRLPNIKELSSLVEYQCVTPAINLVVFPNTSGMFFWSSTVFSHALSYQGWDERAHYVSFYDGISNGSDDYGYKGYSKAVRLVRGGE